MEVSESKGKFIIVECDCGCAGKITRNDEGELKIKTTYSKPKEVDDDKTKKRKDKKPEVDDDETIL